MADARKLAEIFKVLSVDARVRIVQLLKRRSLCVTEITSQLGITQAATSQHLRVLKDAGLVKFQKQGFHVYYHLNKQNLARLDKATGELLRLDD
ncbi:MAG: ArsR/SmtB family transcription factor [Planctomycetota bacterium]|jgi:DNA-binding transcriptional ArsR family regulator